MKLFAITCVLLFVGSVSCGRRKRMAFGAPGGPASSSKASGMGVGQGFLGDELEKEKDLGGPVNPSGLEKASKMVDPTQTSLADIIALGAEQPGFDQYLSKPEDTEVNPPMQGAP